jgi:ribose transport system ATP-binding protein
LILLPKKSLKERPGKLSDGGNLLEISGLFKSYGNPVLTGIDFDLRPGEVHALVGENGAGKSTLARIIAGVTRPEQGTMRLKGNLFQPGSRKQAEELGVRLVMQELNLIPTLTIAENLFIDRLPRRLGFINYKTMNQAARHAMASMGLGHLDPALPVERLGVGRQQLVEIAAGLSRRCDILILDEPTAALTYTETELLFTQIAKLKAQGSVIVYISHRMEEIQRIADRITVLRDGRMIATLRTQETNLPEIIRLMVGRELDESLANRDGNAGTEALRVVKLSSGAAVSDVSFTLRRGEILGFAGLMGSGRTETMRAIFGADRATSGRIHLHGSEHVTRIRSPRQAVREGMALLTEDRKAQGLLLSLSIRTNMTLACLSRLARKGGFIRASEEKNVARQFVKSLGVRCNSIEQTVGDLSGGNQQKIVIGRWLYRDPEILIFDEPTRGIDVGAKFEIYRMLNELVSRGKAIIVVSSDLMELMAICDRIAVMSAGRLADIFPRAEWTQEKIMAAALSGYQSAKDN